MALKVDIKKKLGNFVLRAAFTADQGVTGILGASGCGKSMTLRCIAGIVNPDEGRIELDGTVFFDSDKKINLKPQKRQVGLLFQNYALFPNMTVRQNLLAGLRAREKDREKADLLVGEMIRRFSLEGLEGHRPAQLSGGQQQRAALLSGCKNYSRARPAGEKRVRAEDWGVTFTYEGEAPEDVRYVGIRSHYLHLVPAGEENGRANVFRCRVVRIIEDVFSMVVMVCPEGAAPDGQDGQIRLELSKESWEEFRRREGEQKEVLVWVEPGDEMLLC